MGNVLIESSCLSLDGTRQWLVSGVIDPSRVPRGLWGDRLQAARDAGLNCVGVPVVWSRHEPVEERFLFEGERDIAAFVRQAQDIGLFVALRPGPFIGSGHDRGGIPTWLDEASGIVLRSSHSEFLRASSRWYAALLKHLDGLLATDGGPIVLVQCEHRWFCGDEEEATKYLGELVRYLREHGVKVPIVGSHNLFASVEGAIDAWCGHESLFTTLRQLLAINPGQPAFLMDLEMGRPGVWAQKSIKPESSEAVAARLAMVLAAGGQYQLGPFHGGTNIGFSSGRLPFERDAYLTATADAGAPLDERGHRNQVFHAVRRVSSFASSFSSVFASLDREPVVAVHPESSDLSVVAQRGVLGQITWIFADNNKAGRRKTSLVLSDGRCVEVDLTGLSCAWVVQNLQVTELAKLELCTLSVVGVVGNVLVVVGPKGATGELIINSSHLHVKITGTSMPSVHELEGVRIVACSPAQFENVWLREQGVFIGVSSFDASGAPRQSGNDTPLLLRADGGQEKPDVQRMLRAPASPKVAQWTTSSCLDCVQGTNPRFARIAGPTSLEELGTPQGYGWYRLQIPSKTARRAKSAWFGSGDRLHIWSNSTPVDVVGRGPGATPTFTTLPLKKGDTTVTVLADNLGRVAGGVYVGAKRGLWNHVWEVVPIKAGKPTLEVGEPISPMVFRKPMTRLHTDDMTMPERPTWVIDWRKKSPIAMTLDVCALGEVTGLVLLNDEPIHVFADGGLDHVLLRDKLVRGKNTIQLALVGDADNLLANATKAVRFDECATNLTHDAVWSFAAWERPDASGFAAANKQQRDALSGTPTWWRGVFRVSRVDRPLILKLTGMSKGQLFVNGHNACRYFVATSSGDSVAVQQEYVIHEPWLRTDGDNEIVLFDEHGCSPVKCTMHWD